RRGPVPGHIRRHRHQTRTQPPGLTTRHRRAHAKSPGFVIAGCHHATAAIAPNGERHIPQGWVVTHLDSGVKTIAIHMNDLALGHGQWAQVNNLYVYTALYLTVTC